MDVAQGLFASAVAWGLARAPLHGGFAATLWAGLALPPPWAAPLGFLALPSSQEGRRREALERGLAALSAALVAFGLQLGGAYLPLALTAHAGAHLYLERYRYKTDRQQIKSHLIPYLMITPLMLLAAHALKTAPFSGSNLLDGGLALLPVLYSVAIAQQHQRVQRAGAGALEVITRLLEAKDPYTAEHSRRVARIAVGIGRILGLPPQALNQLYQAGLLHDIGKLAIPETIIDKPGALDTTERLTVRSHPELGYELLEPLAQFFTTPVLQAIKHHHERWDGNGYPHNLQGNEIPLFARIVGVADAYEAMTSERSYRKPFTPEEAVERLLAESGKQFDPRMVAALVRSLQLNTQNACRPET
jgi:HD-GYP domain-containing protein (c-di-GMP phosphodiesterase class II)